jgi:hypothetical protein
MKRLVIKDREGIKDKIQSYFTGNEEAKFIHRLHGVLLFSVKEDESCDSIGALFGNSPRTVSNWIKRINETGDIESLRSKKQSGRPPPFIGRAKAGIKSGITGASGTTRHCDKYMGRQKFVCLYRDALRHRNENPNMSTPLSSIGIFS